MGFVLVVNYFSSYLVLPVFFILSEEPEHSNNPKGYCVRRKFQFRWIESQGRPWWITEDTYVCFVDYVYLLLQHLHAVNQYPWHLQVKPRKFANIARGPVSTSTSSDGFVRTLTVGTSFAVWIVRLLHP
jgi:hypothetical protein